MALSLESKPGQKPSAPYLPYTDAVEKIAPDEAVIFDELSRTMQHITRTMASRYRHAYRPVHAKSHGILVGTLDVPAGLPEPLEQGLFAKAGSYPVIMRFSTNPGDLLSDKVSSPRGLAVKVLNVEGETVANHAGNTTQDFVCVNTDVFSAPDPAGFLKQIKTFDKTLELPEGVKETVSLTARAVNSVIGVVGLHSATLEGVGAPAVHILGESFTTVAPLRYGSYVAKVGFAPASENLKKLIGESVNLGEDYNALGGLIKKFFRHEDAVWEVKVQLALAEKDEKFPIEDASKEWPKEESPWETVGRITVKAQETYSDERQRFVDEQVSFTPWHALAAHRPLGGVMRSRLKAYEEAAKYRAQRNGHPHVEPKSIGEVPA
jgi:catalase